MKIFYITKPNLSIDDNQILFELKCNNPFQQFFISMIIQQEISLPTLRNQ